MTRRFAVLAPLVVSVVWVGSALVSRADDDPAKSADVTAKVAAAVQDNKLAITANNDLFGDPAEGEVKTLRIEFTVGGQSRTRTWTENESVELAAPAGQTLTIKKAVYGVIAAVVGDVTDKVAAAVKDNALSLSVDNDTLGGDPAPGVTKQLRVEYTVGDVTHDTSANEGETLQIAKPEGDKKLVIVKATYAPAPPYADVTDKVAAAVKDGKLSITADNTTFGDPAENNPKQLRVDYTVGGVYHIATAAENDALELPTPTDGTGALVIKKALYGVLPGKP